MDPELLWLWCRPAAVAPIQPLAWEPLYATGVALKTKIKMLAEIQLKHTTSLGGYLGKGIVAKQHPVCFPPRLLSEP